MPKEDNGRERFIILKAGGPNLAGTITPPRPVYVFTGYKYEVEVIEHYVSNHNITTVKPVASWPDLRDADECCVFEQIEFGNTTINNERIITNYPSEITKLARGEITIFSDSQTKGESKRPDVNVRLITIPNDASYIKIADSRGNGIAYKIEDIRESITQEDGFVAGGGKYEVNTNVKVEWVNEDGTYSFHKAKITAINNNEITLSFTSEKPTIIWKGNPKTAKDVKGNYLIRDIVREFPPIPKKGGRKSRTKKRKSKRKTKKRKKSTKKRRRKRKTKSLFKKKRTKKRGYGGKSPKRRRK